MRRIFFAATLCVVPPSAAFAQPEFTNFSSASVEQDAFFEGPQFEGQDHARLTYQGVLQPEFEWRFDSGFKLNVEAYARVSDTDDIASYADLRRVSASYRVGLLFFNAGIEREFWGVAESRHLVDILNQTDTLAGIDGEDKLGQPLAKVRLDIPHGHLDVYKLFGFRERLFPEEGRYRPALSVRQDDDNPHWRIHNAPGDFALRLSQYWGDHQFALSYFSGFSREPWLLFDSSETLTPRYDQIEQTGFEYQGVFDATLIKLESIYRTGHVNDASFWAVTGGFEHTLYGVAGSSMDIGVLAEYHRDTREAGAPETAFQNDFFVGARLTFNDVRSTSLLVGSLIDLDGDASVITGEFETRLGSHWKVGIEGRFLAGTPTSVLTSSIENDDVVRVRLSYFF